MRFVYGWMAIGLFVLGGCSKTATAPSDAGTTAYTGSGPVPIANGSVQLSPANTKIQFVGTHVGPKPDPNARTGGFEKFTGQAQVDPASKKLASVSVDIETGSLWTQQPNLTNHLNSPDFFDTREYPKAKFESTRIEPSTGAGQHNITGNLTLLKTTKEITVPAIVTIDDAGLTLQGDFKIDRSEYGMDRLKERVEKEVALSIVIGEKTEPQKSAGGPGGGGPRPDPVAMFKQRDADSDGKLSGDEIHERMRQDMAEIDRDKDGAVSLEEFQERMRRFGGGPRRGGGPPGADGPKGAPGDKRETGEKQSG